MATVYDWKREDKEDQMKKKATTLLDVAEKAHREGNRNVRTADGALLNVEGFRGEGVGGRWVTVFRATHGPIWIDPETAANTEVVEDLGRGPALWYG